MCPTEVEDDEGDEVYDSNLLVDVEVASSPIPSAL